MSADAFVIEYIIMIGSVFHRFSGEIGPIQITFYFQVFDHILQAADSAVCGNGLAGRRTVHIFGNLLVRPSLS